MTMILEGIKVIDAASFLAGPAAATVMADFGADVIKVEPPQGDSYRALAARHRTDYNWQLTSRNKRDIAVDISQPEGREILLKLIDDADVLLVNFRESQLEKYGLKYEDLKQRNPRLVYGHLSGYGLKGPDKDRRAFDSTAWWARSGILDLVKPFKSKPTIPLGGVGDHASAMSLFGAVMMALYQREKTGEGGFVSTSLLANGAWSNGMHLQGAIAGYDLGALLDEKGYRTPFAQVYETRDGRFILLIVPEPQKEWEKICLALDHEEWITDERFTDMRAIMKQRDLVKELFSSAVSKLSLKQVDEKFRKHEITYSVIEKIIDVVNDPQLMDNEIIVKTDSNHEDYQWTVANPINVLGEKKRAPQEAPDIGQHTGEILRELGMTETGIRELIDKGVVKLQETGYK